MINRQHYYFECVLMSITLVFGLSALVLSPEALFLGALWMVVLGVLQIIHSLILAHHYFRLTQIKSWLIGYWAAAAISLALLFSSLTELGVPFDLFFFPVAPLLISTVPWLITFLFRRDRVFAESFSSLAGRLLTDESLSRPGKLDH